MTEPDPAHRGPQQPGGWPVPAPGSAPSDPIAPASATPDQAATPSVDLPGYQAPAPPLSPYGAVSPYGPTPSAPAPAPAPVPVWGAPAAGPATSPGAPVAPGYPSTPGHESVPGHGTTAAGPGSADPYAVQPGQMPGPPPTTYPQPGYDPMVWVPQQRNDPLAIASLATSCGSIVAGFVFGLLTLPVAMVGLVLGIVSLSRMGRRQLAGKGMAIAGVVIGGVALAFGVLILLVVVMVVGAWSWSWS